MAVTCVFRVDALPFMGVGHLSRCLSLAHVLRAQGMSVHFICRDGENSGPWLVEKQGFTLHRLPAVPQPTDVKNTRQWLGCDPASDADATLAIIQQELGQTDWLVVDHYAIDTLWESRMRTVARRIMVIDDLADRPHDCDVLLDQSLYDNNPYAGLIPALAIALLGPTYALLREEFPRARQRCGIRSAALQRLVVFFGGSDPTGDTLKAIQALNQSDAKFAADIIIGAMNPARQVIEAACQADARLHFACQVDDMAARLAQADLAIGGGGTASWERLCLGLPALLVEQADNQKTNIRQLHQHGVALALGPSAEVSADTIAQAIAQLRGHPEQLHEMSRRAWSMVQGTGAQLVAAAMQQDELTTRPATAEDCEPMFAWRNAPEVRRFAHNPAPLNVAEHRAWFAASLTKPERHLLICTQQQAAVGVVRFDRSENQALVSIYLAPEHLGRGLGVWVLRAAEAWLRQHQPDIRQLSADVLADNRPSHKMFLACGYVQRQGGYEKRIRHE